MYNTKKITWRHLETGQRVESWSVGNSTCLSSAVVKEKNAAYVTLLIFNTREEQVPSEEAVFEVQMTETEFHQKYQTAAEKLIEAIQTPLSADAIGCHEMWNSWLTYDPYEMAAICKDQKIRVVGFCSGITPKHNLIDHSIVQDIGICAEYEDGGRIWCHGSHKRLNEMLQGWARQLDRNAEAAAGGGAAQ